MRTGVAYMGHHNPKHLASDMREMRELGLDDVFVCTQENDFRHFTGKVNFAPKIAAENGLRSIAIFWGALNLFGGGRSSQFLLENPGGFQVARDGSHLPGGCYVNPLCVARIREMIDTVAEAGFRGYFVDEPTPLRDCYCPSCRDRYQEWHSGDLAAAGESEREAFRQRCVLEYVRTISDYCKAEHPEIETSCCLMPCDRQMWQAGSEIDSLDNLGTDIYWVNNDRDVEEMVSLIEDVADCCRRGGKIHHEWLQCYKVEAGREGRITEQGEVLLREKPDALYVWAWLGQVGTTETCADPALAWRHASTILEKAKS
jgi:hypothetical protein